MHTVVLIETGAPLTGVARHPDPTTGAVPHEARLVSSV